MFCRLQLVVSIFCAVFLFLYRHYRDRFDETPSHTGGVSDAYLQKVKDKRDRDRGFYASSSKDKGQSRTTESGKKLKIYYNFKFLILRFCCESVGCVIICQIHHVQKETGLLDFGHNFCAVDRFSKFLH